MNRRNRAWIELNLKHLENNVSQLRLLLPESSSLMPAVKADAYGHGAVSICRALQEYGIGNFCVASIEEGIELRKAGITGQILILGYTHPDLFPELNEYDLTQTVLDQEYGRRLNQSGRKLKVQAAVDTGMHRLGERYTQTERILSLWRMENLQITGIFSHLSVSDGSSSLERGFTEKQIRNYQSVLQRLRQAGIKGLQTHIQGSYGILNYPELKFDFARAGIALYGVLSSGKDAVRSKVRLKPVLSVKARIACVHPLHPGEIPGYGMDWKAEREMKTAVVSIGYGDGIPRGMSGQGYMLVKGQKAPMIGRICMDQLFLDVTNIPDVRPGDEAVFIGESGAASISAEQAASWCGTITNELLSRLGKRLERT